MKKLGVIDACGVPYDVFVGSSTEFHELEDNVGHSDHVRCRILVREGLSPSLFFNALWHEVQHAIWAQSGLHEISEQPWEDANDFEETFIQIFTPHLITALASVGRLRKP